MAQSIDRALELVRRASEEPLSLTEASDVLGVHKSTALRILQSLEAARFVRKTAEGSYVVGTGLIELAQRALGTLDLRQFAARPLRDVQRATGCTVHLAQLLGDEIIYIDKIDSASIDSIQLASRIGRPVSPYASGVGKLILAYMSEEERNRILGTVELVQHTPTTLATLPALEAEFAAIRARGWATDDGELHDFVNCVAVPIKNVDGEVFAALSLTAMKVLTPLDQLVDFLPLLLSTAESLSAEMGYRAAAASA
jgi:DNA-binding IclR family transcriptional regulator